MYVSELEDLELSKRCSGAVDKVLSLQWEDSAPEKASEFV